jgi:methionyl-tRNA formyltransferase
VAESWRVVVFSQIPRIVLRMDEVLREHGHKLVANVIARRLRGNPFPEGLRPIIIEHVVHAPAHIDLLFPGTSKQIAPLLRAYEPDLILSMIFPWLLPPDVLELPRLGAVNSHPGPLPQYRGPLPDAWAIRNGDAELGLVWHRMSPAFDTGPILVRGSILLDPDETPESMLTKMTDGELALLPQVLERVAAGDPGEPQDESQATYAPQFEDEFRWIDWSRPAREIHNQIRSWRWAGRFDPLNAGALTELDGETVRILRSSLEPVEGARELQAVDALLWIVETEAADA